MHLWRPGDIFQIRSNRDIFSMSLQTARIVKLMRLQPNYLLYLPPSPFVLMFCSASIRSLRMFAATTSRESRVDIIRVDFQSVCFLPMAHHRTCSEDPYICMI